MFRTMNKMKIFNGADTDEEAKKITFSDLWSMQKLFKGKKCYLKTDFRHLVDKDLKIVRSVKIHYFYGKSNKESNDQFVVDFVLDDDAKWKSLCEQHLKKKIQQRSTKMMTSQCSAWV